MNKVWFVLVLVGVLGGLTLAESRPSGGDESRFLDFLSDASSVEATWDSGMCTLAIVDQTKREQTVKKREQRRAEAVRELAQIEAAEARGESVDAKRKKTLMIQAHARFVTKPVYDVIKVGTDYVALRSDNGRVLIIPTHGIHRIFLDKSDL